MPVIGVGAGHQDKPPSRPSPGIGGGLGSIGRTLPPPPPPRQSVGGGLRSVGRSAPPLRLPPQTDIQSSGSGYGMQQAAAFKNTPAYRQAIADVFKAQSATTQAGIISRLANMPSSPEGKAIGSVWNQLDQPRQLQIAHLLGPHGALYINRLRSFSDGFRLTGPHAGEMFPVSGLGMKGGGGPLQSLASVQAGVKPSGIAKVIQNAGQDLINLPAETFSTIGTIGGDVLSGHPGKALSDVVNPILQTVEHPVKSFIEHPLNTLWIGGGLLHGATRATAAPVRALAPAGSTVGRALSTSREGVALTANLTHERAPYSRSPLVKAQQVAVEHHLYRRAPDGSLVPKTGWLRDRLLNQEIGQLVGTRERIRRVNQEQVKANHNESISPSAARKVVHAVKTSLAYGPKGAMVPGAAVFARIVDGTIRKAATYTQDLIKHRDEVARNRPALLGDKKALEAHDAYIKTLQKEIDKNRSVKSLQPAFKAAHAYAKAYALVEGHAARLGHFRDMGSEALARRTLMHYAASHMGAKMDEAAGLVGADGSALSNAAIREHVGGPEGTGGRPLAYTSDRVRFDANKKSSFYVPSEHRPLPISKAKNTLYAYMHGLASPGHDALLEQHALMQGIVDAHHAQNTYAETLSHQMPGGGFAKTHPEARDRLRGTGLVPLNLSGPFHPQASLDAALQDVSPAAVEEEIVRRSLDLSSRMDPGAGPGRWAGIDPHALKTLGQFEKQISPNVLLRTIRGLNNQFRTVALSTSAKHIPGVAQENLIRDIAHGVGFRSWVSGRRILEAQRQINPERAREIRTQLTGGQVAGMTEAGKTFHVSEHWAGTTVHPFLKAFEVAFKAPGPRQLRTAWRAWSSFAIQGTKKMLEEQHQIAGLGKAALREHGYAEAARAQGMLGLINRAFGLHGQLLDDAAKGLFDPRKARQARAVIQQIYGKWTDLSPGAQTALMFSPFGLWWANSARFLARMPIDQPIKTGLLAGATEGTQQERQAQGLDMFMKGALPSYEQGGIPIGGKIAAQNYYSPFGVANDPLATGQSLIQPWVTPLVLGSLGLNWLGRPLSSPGNPHGRKSASLLQRLQYIFDSAASSFVPTYTKAQQIAQGGASSYDVSDAGGLPSFPRPTKTPGKGPLAGLEKALLPFREYRKASAAGASGGASGGSFPFGSGGGSGGSGGGYPFGSGGGGGGSAYPFG